MQDAAADSPPPPESPTPSRTHAHEEGKKRILEHACTHVSIYVCMCRCMSVPNVIDVYTQIPHPRITVLTAIIYIDLENEMSEELYFNLQQESVDKSREESSLILAEGDYMRIY